MGDPEGELDEKRHAGTLVPAHVYARGSVRIGGSRLEAFSTPKNTVSSQNVVNPDQSETSAA
jgi:hypothetical protein